MKNEKEISKMLEVIKQIKEGNFSLDELATIRYHLDLINLEKGQQVRPKINTQIIELSYNSCKGTGKCWIAKVDPETKKILNFIDAESRQPRDGFSGQKTFSLPLIEGNCYLTCESGSKSKDDRTYYKVVNQKLESF
jgi:hypothetical protein